MRCTKPIKMIVAHDDARGIGNKNALPWILPADLIRFKNLTSQVKDPTKRNMVVMGKNTWESLPYRPLPKRLNVVLSSRPISDLPQDCIQLSEFMHVIELAEQEDSIESVFIMGGATLYNYLLEFDICDLIYVTHIHGTYEVDTYINTIPDSNYSIYTKTEYGDHDFYEYRKKSDLMPCNKT